MSFVLSIYRIRGAVFAVAVSLLLVGAVVRPLLPEGVLDRVLGLLSLLGLAGFVVVLITIPIAVKHLPRPTPLTVTAPVTGKWLGMNSPIDKIPSHGVRAYGQAYAIDLVYEPTDRQRPAFGTGRAMRQPSEYPAFGEPVRAMTDGIVVTAMDTLRDHRARSSLLSVLYMMIEGALRELGGPRFIVGNHITIRSDDGVYALVAHLRQGSALVAQGDPVRAGQTIAACGNSGNSSEPHLHAQLMDRSSLWTAQGIPFSFAGVQIGESDERCDALPGNNHHVIIQ